MATDEGLKVYQYLNRSFKPIFSSRPSSKSEYQNWDGSWGGTIMPSGPAFDSVQFDYLYDPITRSIHYRVSNYELSEVGKRLIQNIPREQLEHRSRELAVAMSPLRTNEMERRVNKAKELKPWYQRNPIPKRVLENAYHVVIEQTLSQMTFSMDNIFRYITEHDTSSMGNDGTDSYKWGGAQMSSSEWRELYSIARQGIASLADNPGKYLQNDIFYGIRARSEPVQEAVFSGIKDLPSVEISRSRIVTYTPFWTALVMFIPHEKHNLWYQRIFDGALAPMGSRINWHFPPVSGGKVSVELANTLESGYSFHAYDATTWDANVPSVLGDYWNPLFFYYSIPQQPSGSGVTTVDDTIADALQLSLNPPGFEMEVFMLGDDCTITIDPSNSNRLRQFMSERKPYLEFQPEDTAMKFMLGLNYKDYRKPRIDGLKMTKDSAKSTMRLKFSQNIQTKIVGNNLTETERELWYQLYLGDFNGKTLLQAIAGLKEYMSPSVLLDNLVTTETKRIEGNSIFNSSQ